MSTSLGGQPQGVFLPYRKACGGGCLVRCINSGFIGPVDGGHVMPVHVLTVGTMRMAMTFFVVACHLEHPFVFKLLF